MSEFTSIPELKNLETTENIRNAKRKLSDPIIIDEEDEESSDCESERIAVLNTALNSLQQNIKRLSHVFVKKHNRTNFKRQQMQQNEETKEDRHEQSSSPVLEYFVEVEEEAKPNPHTAHSRADDPPKVQLDLRVTAQRMRISCTSKESSTLRDLLQNPIPMPKTSQLKHFKKQIIINTTGGTPIDLSSCQSNTHPTHPRPADTETQYNQSSGSHEKLISTDFEINPQIEHNSAGYSGGHCSYQAYQQHVENNESALTTVQSTNVESQSSHLISQRYVVQEPQSTYKPFTVTSRDPRMYSHHVVESTPTDVQTYPYSTQQHHQYNKDTELHNQIPSTSGNVYHLDSQQIVSQRFTQEQLVVQQMYSENNKENPTLSQPYLPSVFQYHNSAQQFLPTPATQRDFPISQTGEVEELRYWAKVGKLAHESITKLRSLGKFYPYMPHHVQNQIVFPADYPDPNVQVLQEAPAADTEEIRQSVYHENVARCQSVIQNTSDLYNQMSAPVHNTAEQHFSPVNENVSDCIPYTQDIPTGTLNDTNIEQNINCGADNTETPIAYQNSDDAINESANSVHATEMIRNLYGLFEDLKLRENTIIKKLENKCFDHCDTINKVMKTVHDYCASEATNVSAPTPKVAVLKIQRLNVREVDNYNDGSNDDDEEDVDYTANTDEDYDSDREPNRKRIRTCSINFVLPDEYDPTDSRWTWKYRRPDPRLMELLPHSGVYVNKNRLANCKKVAKNSNELARLLLLEVFSHSALTVCSLTGGRPTSYLVEGQCRPGLDRYARDVLLTYVEQVAEEKGWPKVNKNSVMNSMRWKLKKIKEDA